VKEQIARTTNSPSKEGRGALRREQRRGRLIALRSDKSGGRVEGERGKKKGTKMGTIKKSFVPRTWGEGSSSTSEGERKKKRGLAGKRGRGVRP